MSMHCPAAMNSKNYKRLCSRLYYYPLLAVLNYNNYSYWYQYLSLHNYPDHKLLLVALVRLTLSCPSRKMDWCSCSQDLTRNECRSLGNCNKCSCRMRLIFAPSCSFPPVDAECMNTRPGLRLW